MSRLRVLSVLFAPVAVTTAWVGCTANDSRIDPPTTASSSSSSSSSTSASSSSSSGAGGATPIYGCNPLTNDGCGEGQACDANYGTFRFQCFDGPNEVDLCDACGQADGFCAPGSTCLAGDCARFCCDDGDCGPDGVCDHDPLVDFGAGEVGLCLRAPAMGTGGGGGGGGAPCAMPAAAPP